MGFHNLAVSFALLCVGEQAKGLFPTGINKVSHYYYYPLSEGTPNPSNGGVTRYVLSHSGIQCFILAAHSHCQLVDL